jgi:hypothetical protein
VGLGENSGCLGGGGVGAAVVTPEPRGNGGEEGERGGRTKAHQAVAGGARTAWRAGDGVAGIAPWMEGRGRGGTDCGSGADARWGRTRTRGGRRQNRGARIVNVYDTVL